ncbi:MFS transporter [Paracoccus yeei]|uniref:MFS transporter n=1 Tax=Paracoccus yeei TaxID=147645 RepID=UPI00048D320F|nr:MFS transporter [Paracoccus yeei]OWJ97750.1 MFS transporter [Paracoccus yeei]
MTDFAQPLRQATARQGLVIQLASSLTIMGAVMIAPMIPAMIAEFAPAHPRAGDLVPLIATGPALAIALFAPLAGWLADQAGRKRMLMAGTLAYAGFGVLPAFLHDLHLILVSRLLFGCAEAIIMTCCATLIADYWPPAERARYVTRQVVTIGIVGALFFVIGGVVGAGSWRAPFYLYLLPLLLLPAMAALLWEPDRRREEAGGAQAPATGIALPLVLSYGLVFLGMLTSFVVPVMAPVLLVGIGVTSTGMIGLASGLGLLATLAGSLAWPLARRRLGTLGVNALLLAAMALGLYLLAHAQSYAGVVTAVLIHGFGGGFLVANASLPLMLRLPARLRALGMGGFTAALYLGQFANPIVIIAIAGPLGGMPPGLPAAITLWAGAMALLAAGCAAVAALRPAPRPLPLDGA